MSLCCACSFCSGLTSAGTSKSVEWLKLLALLIYLLCNQTFPGYGFKNAFVLSSKPKQKTKNKKTPKNNKTKYLRFLGFWQTWSMDTTRHLGRVKGGVWFFFFFHFKITFRAFLPLLTKWEREGDYMQQKAGGQNWIWAAAKDSTFTGCTLYQLR